MAGGGTFYYYSRMTAAAHGQFEELIRRYPDVPNVHYAFGAVLLNEQPDRAIEEFTKELQRSPAHVPSMMQMAFEYLKRSDWAAARSWAEQAVKAEPPACPRGKPLGSRFSSWVRSQSDRAAPRRHRPFARQLDIAFHTSPRLP